MSDSEHISDENLEKDFPLLFSHSRTENVEAPEGYFDTFPSRIIEKVKNLEEAKVISIQKKRRWIYAAASIAAVVLIAFLVNNPSSEEFTTEEYLLNFDNVEITEDYLLDFDEALILELLYAENNLNEDYEDPYIEFLEEEFETEELIFEL